MAITGKKGGLIQRMIRAKSKLEDTKKHLTHRPTCPLSESGHFASCDCGVSQIGERIQSAIDELK